MSSSGSPSTSSGTFSLDPWGWIMSQGVCGSPSQGFMAHDRLPTMNGRDQSAGPVVPRRRVRPKRHCFVVLLPWHTHGFYFLFSGIMVLVEGVRGGRTGVGLFFLICLWKWKSGSSVALQRLSLHSSLGSSVSIRHCMSGFARASLRLPSLSFPFPLVTANMAHARVSPEKPGSLPLAS